MVIGSRGGKDPGGVLDAPVQFPEQAGKIPPVFAGHVGQGVKAGH